MVQHGHAAILHWGQVQIGYRRRRPDSRLTVLDLTPGGYRCSVNVTVTVITTGTATPLSRVGIVLPLPHRVDGAWSSSAMDRSTPHIRHFAGGADDGFEDHRALGPGR